MSWCLGITVGPICDTLSNAASPAGLWFCSTFFSNLTRRLCSSFTDKYSGDIEILSPFFSVDDNEAFLQDGVGKYHDRIIIRFNKEYIRDELEGDIREIVERVKNDSVNDFPEAVKADSNSAKFFHDYLQIHFVLVDKKDNVDASDKNIIFELSPYLDALELMQTYPASENGNLFHRILTHKEDTIAGGDENRNKMLKESVLLKKVPREASQLLKSNGNIWSINEIANCHGTNEDSNLKKHSYFAIVQADGDFMGKLMGQLSADKDIKEVSGCLLDYAKCAAGMVGEFGGMTIYAGGDDLLFLAPVESADGRTIFDLCIELNEMFVKKLQLGKTEAEKSLSLSFGIAIQYNKFPLYEALNKAGELLFGVAKQGNKKAMAVELQKHSGQTIRMLMPLVEYETVHKECRNAQIVLQECNRADLQANSVIQTLSNHIRILEVLDKEAENRIAKGEDFRQQYLKAWHNFQDNVGQKEVEKYYDAVGSMYYDCFLRKNSGIKAIGLGSAAEESKMQALIAFLKMYKFLQEKRGEGE